MIEVLPNWHPILVHFTVALMSVATLCFLLTYGLQGWERRDEVIKVAEWNFWLGSFSAIAAVLAGWYAFNTVNHDAPSHVAMTIHRNWALVTVAVIFVLDVWLWRIQKARTKGITHAFAFALVIFLGLLGATSWHGGELVYRYGLGVMSLPVVEGAEGHDHAHGDSHEAPVQHETNTGHEQGEDITVKIPMRTSPDQNDMHDVNHSHAH